MQRAMHSGSKFPLLACGVLISVVAVVAQPSRQTTGTSVAPYYPDRFDWQKRTPEQAGMDAAKLDAAIKFAMANENPGNKDLAIDLATTFGREPFDTPIGPVKPRGALNGIIVKNGYIVAEWGETTRVGHDVQRDQELSVDGRRARCGRKG